MLLEGLTALPFELDDRQVEALLELAQLLESWARRINLTGHRERDQIVRRLVLDALALAAQIPDTPSLADLGSGAGFPGLPIAIARPGCRVSLVESRRRPFHFQRTAVRALGLGNVRPRLGRAERLEPDAHAAAVAQAMARPAEALEKMLPWVEPGGLLLLPGSETPPRVPELREVSEWRVTRYRVPPAGPDRTLWIGQRA